MVRESKREGKSLGWRVGWERRMAGIGKVGKVLKKCSHLIPFHHNSV